MTYETYTCTHTCIRCHTSNEYEFHSNSPECPHWVQDDDLMCPSCFMDSQGCNPNCPNRTDIDADCLEDCK